MNLEFGNLGALHWLWAVAALAALVVFAFRAQARALVTFAGGAALARLLARVSPGRQYLRAVLVLGAMTCLVAGLLDPRWGESYQEVRQQGIDIMVVLDVSRSMLAEDARPDRLERARQYVRDLLDVLAGDRVGLVTFAGTASLACPLTIDYGALALSLAEAGPDLAGRGGSLLGDALRKAGESFTDEVKEYKAIICLSDGEDHGSYPREAAAQLFDEKGIRVYTVGLGDATTGARIPVVDLGRTSWLRHEGEDVWSKMDPATLRDVALAGGGAYIPAGTGNVDLGRVYEERIAPASKREFGTVRIERKHVQYQWFAALALVLLVIESLVGDRR